MANLVIEDRNGITITVQPRNGQSLMEIIRESGNDDFRALCGGCCSCATCHIFVHPAFLGKMAPMNEDENDLLDASSHRSENSRLSCQLIFYDELDGLRVIIAPED